MPHVTEVHARNVTCRLTFGLVTRRPTLPAQTRALSTRQSHSNGLQQNPMTMILREGFPFVYLYVLWDWFTYLLNAIQRQMSARDRSITGRPPAEPAHRVLFKLVDLSLLRRTDELRKRVLPYGIRQLIKQYLVETLDNANIRSAVKLWCENRDAAIHRYGHISLWDTHCVTDMSLLFSVQKNFNDDISGWDVSKVTTMRDIFYRADSFNQPIGDWTTSKVTDMRGVFDFAVAFNQPLDDWDVSSVKTLHSMFCGAYAFDQPLSKWDVSAVTNMSFMFAFTKAFDQPLNAWDVSRLERTYDMFWMSESFNQPLDRWNLTAATDISYMFKEARAFNQPLVSWNIATIDGKKNVFKDADAYHQPETMEVWRAAGYRD